MEDILVNPETTYTIIATGQKDKDYYQKYIDNNIAGDFNRVVEFIEGILIKSMKIEEGRLLKSNKEWVNKMKVARPPK